MSNVREWLHTIERSQDETPTTDTSATPSAVADATMSPLSPLGTLLDFLSISSSHPAPQLSGPVATQSIPSSPQHQPEGDDPATDPDALEVERERDTAYGKVLLTEVSSKLRLRLIPNGTQIPPLQEEEEQEEPQEEQLQSSCGAVADMEREIQEQQTMLNKLMSQFEEMERRHQKKLKSHLFGDSPSDEPEDSSSSVRRNGRKEHRTDPYPRPRGSKPKRDKRARFHCSSDPQGLHNDDEFYLRRPNHTAELPIVRDVYPEYRPPTPHPSAMAIPEYDLDEQEEWVHTRPNTPPPTEGPALCLSGVPVLNVVRQPTVEKIDDVEDDDDDDRSSVVAQADERDIAPVVDHAVTPELLDEAHALLADTFAELHSANASSSHDHDDSSSPARVSATYLTPARSTPGLYTDCLREASPVESPFPKTPLSPPGGLDGQVAVRSPKPSGYEEIFGTSDDEDNDDLLPNPRNKSAAATENAEAEAEAAPSQRSPTPPSAQAPAPTGTESVVASNIPSQHPLPPSSTMPAVDLQREMSWTALPISSLPAATAQPPHVQPASTFTQSAFAWSQPVQYQAPPTSWSQSAFTVPASTPTWIIAPQYPATFSQPIAIPQLHPFVQNVNVAPPLANGEADMTMDVDLYVDVAPPRPRRLRNRHRPRPGRSYRRAAHDPIQAARHLLRVAAVEPALDLRKRAVRRLFQHLFAIRKCPAAVNLFHCQTDRAVRKSLLAQWLNRKALRRARRSVQPTLRRLGRAARSNRSAPQPLQRTMSIDMSAQDPSFYYADADVDMDSSDLPATSATETPTESMSTPSGTVFQSSSAPPVPSQPAIPVNITIPIIIVTPDSPLPQQQSQEKPPAARGEPAPLPPPSVVPEPAVAVAAALDSAKSSVAYHLREESSLAEFEVPLVQAAAPAPAPVSASASDSGRGPTAENNPTPTTIPEAVVEVGSQPSASAQDDAGETSDDETEWEAVHIPAVSAYAPAIPTATPEHVPVEESGVSAPAEREDAVKVYAPAPHIAEAGPVIVFHSTGQEEEDDDDDDAISLGYSEDEAECRAIYGEDGEEYAEDEEEDDGDYEDGEEDEDYEDDGEEEDEEEEEDEDREETEEETEEEDDEEEEESNEYDESVPINGPVKRAPASASAPPVSLPVVTLDKAFASPMNPLPPPNVIAPSAVSAGLTRGPYMGSIAERYDESAAYSKSMQLLTSTANVSSGTRLSGAAAQGARAQARLRNHANQVKQRNAAQNLIWSIAGKSSPPLDVVSAPKLNPVPFEVATACLSGNAPPAVDKDGAARGRAPDDVVMPADEDAEIVLPRLHKGKSKAADWDALLVAHAPDIDPSVSGIVDGLGLSAAEVRLNLNAFPRPASKSRPALSRECGCGRLSDGPSSGHTLACQNARGTLPVASKPPSDGASIASALPPSGAYQDSRSSVVEVSPQIEQSASKLETGVSATLVDQGDRQSTQPSMCLPASPPRADEQPTPVTEFVKEDTDQQLTGVAKAWDDVFAIPVQSRAAPESLSKPQESWLSAPDSAVLPLHAPTLSATTLNPSTMNFSAEVNKMLDTFASSTFTPHNAAMNQELFSSPVETAPFAALDFSALASGLGADLALDQQLHDLLSSLPDPTDFVPIDGLVVDDSGPQDVAPVLPVSAFEAGCMPMIFSQVQEVGDFASKVEDPEGREGRVQVVSCPLAAPLRDRRQDRLSEAPALGFALSEKRPHLECDTPAGTEGLSQVAARTESGVPEMVIQQLQSPSEQSLPANWVPPSLTELSAPLPPAIASIPPPSSVPQDETARPVAEEHTEELERLEDPSSASIPEAEDQSPSLDVPAPPPMSLVRRRSGGLHDRIACSYEKRTYYGPRPCSEEWQAFIAASPLRASRRSSCGVANKSPSPSSSPVACWPARPCRPSGLSTASTSPDVPMFAAPARGRPRRRAAALTTLDQPKAKKDVATQTTRTSVSSIATEKRKSRGKAKAANETHAPPTSSSSTPSLPDCTSPDSPRSLPLLRLPSWLRPPCCPNFSRTGREPCIHGLRASGQLAGTQWESESSDSDLEEEKNVSWPQGWSAGYLAKLSLAAGACYFLEKVVF